jgi:serine/threonine-protein kinase
MRIGRYEVLAEIGRGGAGRVVRARSPEGGEVAIKVLLEAGDEGQRARFLREAQLLGDLGEAHGFVPVLDRGKTAEGPFIVLPFLAGGTLRARLAKGALGVEETVSLGLALARAVGAAHARGIVHRDLKPENVLFTKDGRPLVADLGLARQRFGAESLTQSGVVGGTLGYMPPEQLDALRAAGPPADVFALGAILYECLAGKRAFEAKGILSFVKELERGPAPLAAACPEAPGWLVLVIERALAAAPAARFPDGQSLAVALESRKSARVRRRASALLVALASGLVLGVALSRGKTAGVATPSPVAPTAPRVKIEIHAPAAGALLSQDVRVEATVTGATSTMAEIALVLSSGSVSRKVPIGPRGKVEALLDVRAEEAPGCVELRVDGETTSVRVLVTQAPLRHLPKGLGQHGSRPLPDGTTVALYEYSKHGLAIPMVWVPPGPFLKGAAKTPAKIGAGFWIGCYETTRGEYMTFCEATRRELPRAPTFYREIEEHEARHPISNVTWRDAVDYCTWAGLRLPTSDEWERAARGTEGRLYPWGDEWDPGRANFADSSCPKEVDTDGEGHMHRIQPDLAASDGFPYTAPVGSFPSGVSPVGAFDMAGNVWEMTDDTLFHGGSWWHGPTECATTSVSGAADEERYLGLDLGFRVALGGTR